MCWSNLLSKEKHICKNEFNSKCYICSIIGCNDCMIKINISPSDLTAKFNKGFSFVRKNVYEYIYVHTTCMCNFNKSYNDIQRDYYETFILHNVEKESSQEINNKEKFEREKLLLFNN